MAATLAPASDAAPAEGVEAVEAYLLAQRGDAALQPLALESVGQGVAVVVQQNALRPIKAWTAPGNLTILLVEASPLFDGDLGLDARQLTQIAASEVPLLLVLPVQGQLALVVEGDAGGQRLGQVPWAVGASLWGQAASRLPAIMEDLGLRLDAIVLDGLPWSRLLAADEARFRAAGLRGNTWVGSHVHWDFAPQHPQASPLQGDVLATPQAQAARPIASLGQPPGLTPPLLAPPSGSLAAEQPREIRKGALDIAASDEGAPQTEVLRNDFDLSVTTLLPSGVGYSILQAAEEGEIFTKREGHRAFVHWSGFLPSGQRFDSSRLEGRPLVLTVGDGALPTAVEEGMEGMRVGEIRKIVLPPGFAGQVEGVEAGVPDDVSLVYEVHLLEWTGF